MNLIIRRNSPDFVKGTVYYFMKMLQIKWIRFTTVLCSGIIKDVIVPLDFVVWANVRIINNFMFERDCSKKVVLLVKI